MKPRRKHIPLAVKVDALLIILGFDPTEAIEWDHTWALALRPINEAGDDYDPPQLDPRWIGPKRPGEHANKTFGPGGEKRIHTRGSDIGELAHERRVTKKHEEFRVLLLAKSPGEKRKPRGRIRSRGFQKRRKEERAQA